jgi:hypothetical protein
MNRPICQNCFFFSVNDRTCNYLIVTGKCRNCTPTNTKCKAKLTESEAIAKGYKKASDILRVWIPEDEFQKVREERRKIYDKGNIIKDLVWQTKRYQK